MKKLELKQGGHPLRNDDFNFMQTSYFEVLKGIMSIFDASGNCIMSGVNITETITDIIYTSGYICWQGEIFIVDGGTFPKVVGQQLFFKLEEDVLYPSPVTYKDQTIQNVHIDRKLILKYFTVGDTGEYLAAFSRVSSLGLKRGMQVDYIGNVAANFDSTGLGINEMAGFAICNGNTFTISGGILYTVPDRRGRTSIGASNVPSTGAPSYDTTLGVFNIGSASGENFPKILRTHLPNYNLPIVQIAHQHDLPNQIMLNITPVAGGIGGSPDWNNDPNLKTDPAMANITVQLGGLETAFPTTGAYCVGIPVIKL